MLNLLKILKKYLKKFDIRQFLVLLYDFVPNMKNYWSIDRLLKNVNALQVGTGKNLLLYIVIQKRVEIF